MSKQFVEATTICNDLMVHEYRQGDVPSLENLKYTADEASNAAYRYLRGVRRLADPFEKPAMGRRKIAIVVMLAFIAGAVACFYAFNI